MQSAIRGAGAGAAWAGADDYIRQSKDVEINRLDDISKPQVLATAAFGGTLGFGVMGGLHKAANAIRKNTDMTVLTKAEADELEAKTSVDETVPIADKEIELDDVDVLRNSFLEAQRELDLRDRLSGKDRPGDFIREGKEPLEDTAPLQFGSKADEVVETDADLVRGRPSRSMPIPPEIREWNKKNGGAGSKTDEELYDIIAGVTNQLAGETTETVNSALAFRLKRFANGFGTNIFFKPSSILNTFAKYSDVAKSLQKKFRYDTQRSFNFLGRSGSREYDKQDFSEVFKEILGENYVSFKTSVEPIQSTMSGKLVSGVNNVLYRALTNPKLNVADSQTMSQAVSGIRTVLNKIGDELLETGVIKNKIEAGYFPRLWNRKAIEKNKSNFAQKLVKSGEANNLEEANTIVENMLNKNNQLDQGGGSGGAGFFYRRTFNKINDEDFADYLDTDINSVMLNYIAQSSKAIAKRKVFGVNNLEEFTNFYINGIETQMKEAGQVLRLKDKKNLQKLYNHATGENLSRFEGNPSFALDAYATINRMAYLPLATISSLTEIFINVAKAGPTSTIKGLVSALGDGRKTIQNRSLEVLTKKKGLTESEAWRELQEFGMALDPILIDTVERLSGSLVRNKSLQQANNLFFRATFLDQWTKFVQLASYKTGKDLIHKNLKQINSLKGVPDSNRIRDMKDQLNELGVDIDRGLQWIDSGASIEDDFYKNIKRGAARYTNEVILNPTGESGLKPFWTGDPKSAILFQFLGYPIAFTNTVLKNASKAVIRNPTQNAPKVLAAGLIMTEMARWTNWARSRGEAEKGKSTGEIYLDAFYRWGGSGIVLDLMERAQEATKVYQDPVAGFSTFFGPVGNDVYKIIKRGDIVRIMGEKIPGFGALNLIAPEFKKDYVQFLKEESKDIREPVLEALGATREVEAFRVNRAEGGEIKEEIAQELKDNLHLNFVKRILDPKLTIEIEKGRPSTHMMASAEVDGKEIVYPTIVEIEPGKLKQLSDDEAVKYAIKTGEYIEFNNVKDARAFAEGAYKKGTKLNKAKGGEVKVPNAAPEPDERIDKMTGLPYNFQAGPAFMDEEDPLKRLGLVGGGTVNTDPLRRLGFKKGGEVPKEDKDFFDKLGEKVLKAAGSVDRAQLKVAESLGLTEEDLKRATDFGKTYPENTQDRGRGDAARHMMLGYYAAQTPNPERTLLALNARDIFTGLPTGEGVAGIRMDTSNNAKGYALGGFSEQEAQEKIRDFIESGEATYFDKVSGPY